MIQIANQIYDGRKGAWLNVASFLSGHKAGADRLFRSRKSDLRGCRQILDIGCGAGQLSEPLLRYADPEAHIVSCDLSHPMVRRASRNLHNPRVDYVVADLSRLPFPAESFDCVTCGFVLEYLPDPCDGLCQIARILKPRGRLFLFCMFDNFSSRLTSDIWGCRTLTRDELLSACDRAGLRWQHAQPFDLWQRLIRGDGICGALQRIA